MPHTDHNYPAWLRQAAIYHVYLPSFQDSNSDGIGDLQGLTRRLDYIADLGFNTVWLSPCFDSPFRDGGYDIRDYYSIAPRYGCEDDLLRLFEQARQKGMRVLLDLVIGHTSIDHPWFVESARHERNPYSDWYIWTDAVWEEAQVSPGNFVSGIGKRNGNFLANFFYHQPALNHGFGQPDPDKPWQYPVGAPELEPLLQEIESIMRYWLDRGADGYRVDLAGLMVKNDPTREGTRKYWQRWRQWFDREYPEAALLAEWGKPDEAIDCGFHLDFMLHSYNEAYNSLFRQEAGRNVVTTLDGPSYFDPAAQGDFNTFRTLYEKHRQKVGQRGYVVVPSGNHDLPRLRNQRNIDDIKAIMTFLLTLPGAPCLYYGDELGLPYRPELPSHEGGYNRSGSRTPMPWTPGPNAGFSQGAPDSLFLPLHPEDPQRSVETQSQDPDSLLNHVRRLMQLRREQPALGNETPIRFIPVGSSSYPLLYQRGEGPQACWVLIHPGADELRIRIPDNPIPQGSKPIHASGCELEYLDGECYLVAAPVSWTVFTSAQ